MKQVRSCQVSPFTAASIRTNNRSKRKHPLTLPSTHQRREHPVVVTHASTNDHDRTPPTPEVPLGAGVPGGAHGRRPTPAPAPTPPLRLTTAPAAHRQTAAGPRAQSGRVDARDAAAIIGRTRRSSRHGGKRRRGGGGGKRGGGRGGESARLPNNLSSLRLRLTTAAVHCMTRLQRASLHQVKERRQLSLVPAGTGAWIMDLIVPFPHTLPLCMGNTHLCTFQTDCLQGHHADTFHHPWTRCHQECAVVTLPYR